MRKNEFTNTNKRNKQVYYHIKLGSEKYSLQFLLETTSR